jgi:hypothetical protein
MRVLIGRVGVFGLGSGRAAAGSLRLAELVEVEALHEGRSLLIMTERKLTSTLRSPATRSARTRPEIPIGRAANNSSMHIATLAQLRLR